jgi:arabinosyltransferase
LKIGILPVSMFASGHTFFTQRMPERFDLDPYVAHATFQFSGTPGKRNRFRERLLWDDPSDYFEHPGGFVVVDNDIPAAMLKAAEKYQPTGTLNATLPHFNMVNLQLRVLRALFGISTALNRVAVLPSLWCGQDRWW